MIQFHQCIGKSRIFKVILPLLLILFLSSLISYAENITYASHKVQKGESIWSISQKYQISKNDLLSINNINENDIISIGQIIKIPQMGLKADNKLMHYVKKGETLWSISQKYNVQVNSIISANNLRNSDVISIGQSLLIPGTQDANFGINSNQDLNRQITSQEEMKKPFIYRVKKGR